jgi:DNA repair exonuclease SbcCD ATPase subunit
MEQAVEKVAGFEGKLKKVKEDALQKKAARKAGKEEMRDADKKVGAQQEEVNKAKAALKEAKEALAKERETTEEMEVNIQVLGASSGVGDSNIRLDKAKKKQDSNTAKYNEMKSSKAAMQARMKTAKEARDAAKQNLKDMRLKRRDLRKGRAKATKKWIELKFQHKELKRRERKVGEALAGAKGQAKEATKYQKECQDKVTAIDTELANAKDPSKTLKTEKLRESAAIGEAQDEDGIGKDGQALVAKDGDIAKKFLALWKKANSSSRGNPLVEAEARAAEKSTVGDDASEILKKQGVSGNGNSLTSKLTSAGGNTMKE